VWESGLQYPAGSRTDADDLRDLPRLTLKRSVEDPAHGLGDGGDVFRHVAILCFSTHATTSVGTYRTWPRTFTNGGPTRRDRQLANVFSGRRRNLAASAVFQSDSGSGTGRLLRLVREHGAPGNSQKLLDRSLDRIIRATNPAGNLRYERLGVAGSSGDVIQGRRRTEELAQTCASA
jgi:hypothetical protein